MQYVGMMTQIRRNNLRSVLLLLSFPLIILATVWVFLAIILSMGAPSADAYGNVAAEVDYDAVNRSFVAIAPWVVGIVGVWFLIAYFANSSMVRAATGARPLTRRENPRVYNIVENLCMTCNMDMPQINIVNDPQLNAFASGIDKKSYTVTVTTGLLRALNDDELAGVLGHELTHIRDRDTRVLITSIVFVGIVSPIEGMSVGHTAFVIAGSLLILKGMDDFILQPTLYSERVKAHPLEIFLVILIAGSLAGILGMLLAIPSYTVLRVFAKEFFSQFRLVRKLTEKI